MAPVTPSNAMTPPFWLATQVEPTPTTISGVPSRSRSPTAGAESIADGVVWALQPSLTPGTAGVAHLRLPSASYARRRPSWWPTTTSFWPSASMSAMTGDEDRFQPSKVFTQSWGYRGAALAGCAVARAAAKRATQEAAMRERDMVLRSAFYRPRMKETSPVFTTVGSGGHPRTIKRSSPAWITS